MIRVGDSMSTSCVRKTIRGLLVVTAFFSAALTILEALQLPPATWQHPLWQYVPYLFFTAFILSIFLSFKWESKRQWMDAVIRYWLAFELCVYGFAKIFGTQFSSPYYIQDTPVSGLNGFNLTWIYFGHSYTFAVIIAAVQIFGSILLLFRRTTLPGAVILLPAMFTIVLINVFYGIAAGALLNSVLFTLSLLYLISPHTKSLLHVLLPHQDAVPSVAAGIRGAGKMLVVVAAFSVIYLLKPHKPPEISGRWKVESLTRSKDTNSTSDIMKWKTIYVEEDGSLAFCSNPYLFDQSRTMWANYRYDHTENRLRVLFESGYLEPDSITITIRKIDHSRMEWNLVFQKRSVHMQLSR